MHVTDIAYVHEGTRYVGMLAVDDTRSGRRPAVLVGHEGIGLGDHPKRSAQRLAELGYVAFALDYYGGGALLPSSEVFTRYTELANDPARIRAVGGAGLDVLLGTEWTDTSRVAAIGYCFGGTLALELARGGADLKAVVGFHSGLATPAPAAPGSITGSVLVCLGAEDPIVPLEQRNAFEEEMRAAGADWRMLLMGGAAHSFTNPYADGRNPGMRYDERAAARAWRAMLDLFGEVF